MEEMFQSKDLEDLLIASNVTEGSKDLEKEEPTVVEASGAMSTCQPVQVMNNSQNKSFGLTSFAEATCDWIPLEVPYGEGRAMLGGAVHR